MKIEDLEKAEGNVSVDGLPIAVAQRGSRGGRRLLKLVNSLGRRL
ncbi:hypothetical protein [Peribacillus frigoritolerans]